jgi:hypothetical protein
VRNILSLYMHILSQFVKPPSEMDLMDGT